MSFPAVSDEDSTSEMLAHTSTHSLFSSHLYSGSPELAPSMPPLLSAASLYTAGTSACSRQSTYVGLRHVALAIAESTPLIHGSIELTDSGKFLACLSDLPL